MNARLAALDFITGCLSVRRDPAIDEGLHSLIVSQDLHWDTLMDIAQIQRIAPALWAALRSRGLAKYLPLKVRDHLFKLHLLNTLRNKNLREQVIEVIRQFNSMGVDPLLLKGGISLLVETFDDPGSRVMADLDLLVPKSAAEDCWNALCTLGYLPIKDNPHYHIDYHNCHHHLRPLYRPGSHGMIEIHRDALPTSAARILPTSMIWEQSEPVVNSLGLTIRIPSPTHRVLHILLHSDLINQIYVRGKLSLRSLHELVRMQTIYREQLDWETIRQRMDRSGHGQVLRASLHLADRLFGSPMPDCMRPTFGAAIHYARTRWQVRWPWLDELMERVFWFSTESICERYHCDDRFWSLTKGRVRLASQLARKYGSRAFCLTVKAMPRP
jgi:hypothetical protein